ncbi:MAG TPA: chorismate-binding protein, partial [Alphaproteobacteria bacterium]|nr:chorismate-binding protein [Alphaproteobacteria bacterium]
MTLFAFPVPQSATEIATIFCRKPNTIWFDSAREGHPQSKYSYILFNPVSLTRLVPSIPSPLRGEGQGGGEKERGGDKLPPFQGGWAGYWAYDGSEHLHYYEELFSFDHAQKKGWYLCRAASQDDAEKKFEKIKETVIARSGKAPWRSRRKYKILNVLDCFVRRCLPGNDKEVKWQSDFTQQEYQHAVQNIINHILEGDIFQANLTRKIWADAPEDFDPFDQYLKLRQTNPAPFAAYMNLGSFHILSASPESFLSLSANEDVITRPIKGTAKSAEDLKKSEKDYAE